MPVNKVSEFGSTRVEICRNCKGSGWVAVKPSIETSFKVESTCPVCDGKGRIRKTIKGTVTVDNLVEEI